MGARAPTMSTATPASARLGLREPTARTTSTSALRGEVPSHTGCSCLQASPAQKQFLTRGTVLLPFVTDILVILARKAGLSASRLPGPQFLLTFF